jgi:hypothetical protein
MADYSFVKDNQGNVQGLWLREPTLAHDQNNLLALLLQNGHPVDLLARGYRIEPNTMDDAGGCFVIFESAGAQRVSGEEHEALSCVDELERLLAQHLTRVKQSFATADGFQVMESHWNRLLRPNVQAFTVNVVRQELQRSLEDNRHRYQTQEFGRIFVAVSVIPALNPAIARKYFVAGYSGFMGQLIGESGYHAGGLDLAHWVVCSDGRQQAVHLTFLPDMKLIETQGSSTISILAQDLMTEDEKAEAGII